jgi:aminodeoxychorismate lyase
MPANFVFLNGELVPEERALISVFDRGFLYGDGLFETLRVCQGRPFRWDQHWRRLERGAEFLKLQLPYTSGQLRAFAEQLITANQMPESLLRITVSRGVGPRGYSPKGADRPTPTMSLHHATVLDPQQPPRWRLITATLALPPDDPLASFKTANKLRQILARSEADAAGADEALLWTAPGHLVEGSASNLFWIEGETVCTPPLDCAILPGVTRAVVFEICNALSLPVRECSARPDELVRAQGVFLSVSSFGVVEAISLDGLPLKQSPIVPRLTHAYAELLRRETMPAES